MLPIRTLTLLALTIPLFVPGEVAAQYPPPPQYQPPPPPPPQYQQPPSYPEQPPPSYAAPPPAPYPGQPVYPYAPPPPYPYVPPPRPPPYHEGDPVPPGYHVEERPRSGLVVSGWVLLLVPYGISALTAVGTKGDNESGWLYAPVVGPWFVLGGRRYSGCGQANSDTSDSLGCVGDLFAVLGLVVDGVLQAAGATLLFVGYLNPKQVVVHDEPAFRVLPMRIGSGEGIGARWTF